jgi:O-succinylbenzoic acid--CoA ligase
VSSLRPVAGTAAEILTLLREWDDAADPPPLVVETSGSTGTPKRVVLSRAAMRASADATHARLGGPGRWVLNLPPTYVAGLQVLFRSVRAATEPVHYDDDRRAAGQANKERRYLSLVPTQLHRMLDSAQDSRWLAGFDAVLVGGGPFGAPERARAADAGITCVTTYGMSETCGGCVYDGRPLDGVGVRVDAGGRVWISGPTLFEGYDGDPGLTAEVLQDGWFATSDLGEIDDAGLLHVQGRVDDVIISGGVNVPTDAVAARLSEHPSVEVAAVLGVPDAEWGQRVVALVVGELSVEAAREWVAERHPRAWAPREVLVLDTIPLLTNGKVDRLALGRLVRG